MRYYRVHWIEAESRLYRKRDSLLILQSGWEEPV